MTANCFIFIFFQICCLAKFLTWRLRYFLLKCLLLLLFQFDFLSWEWMLLPVDAVWDIDVLIFLFLWSGLMIFLTRFTFHSLSKITLSLENWSQEWHFHMKGGEGGYQMLGLFLVLNGFELICKTFGVQKPGKMLILQDDMNTMLFWSW